MAGRAQGGVDEVGGGGLAVGAGHADELEGARPGSPSTAAERGPAPRARPGPGARALPAAPAASEATAAAPFLRAASTNWLPSAARPRMATKRAPGPALRESWVTAVIAVSPSPVRTAPGRPRGQLAAGLHRRRLRARSTHVMPGLDLRARLRRLRDDAARSPQLDDQAAAGGGDRAFARGRAAQVGHEAGLRRGARRRAAAARLERAARRGSTRRHAGARHVLRAEPRRAQDAVRVVRRHRQVAQRVLGDAREERGGHVAALVVRAARRVERDEDHERRPRGGHEAHERGHVVDHRVAAGGVDLLRRARLARHHVARRWPRAGRCRSTTTPCRISVRVSAVARLQHAPHGDRPRLAHDAALAVLDLAHDRRLHQVAAVGHRRHRRRHLQRGDADLLAEGERGQARARSSGWAGAGGPPDSPGSSTPVAAPKPKCAHVAVEVLAAQALGHADHARRRSTSPSRRGR